MAAGVRSISRKLSAAMRPVHLGVLRMNLLNLFAVLALMMTAMPPLSIGPLRGLALAGGA
jgi:hypothetical protein